VVRAWSDRRIVESTGMLEWLLALIFFVSAALYTRVADAGLILKSTNPLACSATIDDISIH
jgi:uncharacterized membrane protein